VCFLIAFIVFGGDGGYRGCVLFELIDCYLTSVDQLYFDCSNELHEVGY